MRQNYNVTLVKCLFTDESEGTSFANVDEILIVKGILKKIGAIEPPLSNPDTVEEFKLAVMILQ